MILGLVCAIGIVIGTLMSNKHAYQLGRMKMKKQILDEVFSKDAEYLKSLRFVLEPEERLLLLNHHSQMFDSFVDTTVEKS